MQDNFDLKNLWQQQKTNPPDMKELLQKLKQFKQKNWIKLIFINIVMVVTCGFIIFIWLYYQPSFISTKMGIILVILAMIVFLLSYNKSAPLFKSLNNGQSNNDYLHHLILLKQKQKHLQTTLLSVYFVMLMVGICLYMYEYTVRMNLVSAIVTYVITLAWIAFNWFYIRPKTIKKQQQKLDELITKFEMISKDLTTE